jgi:hypothetical protein
VQCDVAAQYCIPPEIKAKLLSAEKQF